MKHVNIFDDEGPIDIKLIEEFEEVICQNFPNEYKILLSQHDAACPEECIFTYRYDNQILKSDISFFGYGNLESEESIKNVQQYKYSHENIIVFGGTSNGDYISFDFRKSKNPSIVLMLHDVFDKDKKMIVIHLSDNFIDFVNSLKTE